MDGPNSNGIEPFTRRKKELLYATSAEGSEESCKEGRQESASHHHDKHHQVKDLRRAYEQMSRVAVLRHNSKSSATDAVAELTALAQRAIKDGHNKDAADLLRASEHLSFAIRAGEVSSGVRVSAELKESITEQFDELTRRANEHWEKEEEHSSILTEIYQSARNSATKR